MTVRAPAGAVVTAELVVLAVVAVLGVSGLAVGWPVVASVFVVVLASVTVRVHGHSAAHRVWLWLRDRRAADVGARIPVPVDVRRGDLLFGIQRDADTATAVIEVYGKQYELTTAVGRRRTVTRNTLPLKVIAEQLIQPGPLVLSGIDIVSSGSRIARAHGYPPVYSAVLQEQPAAGRRRTYVIVRLDIARSIQGLALRDTVENAAAAVAERLVCALRQRGCRAAPLSSASVLELIDELAAPVLAGRARPRGRYVDNDGSYWATYSYSAADITSDTLNDAWSWRVDAAVTTITVSRAGDDAVVARALVRTQTPQIPQLAPEVYLNPLPGQQIQAALSCVPGAARVSGPAGPCAPAGLLIPVGPAGILVGTVDDCDQLRPVLLPLTDGEHNTRIRVDDLTPDSVYLRQLLIRSAAVGHRVVVYTDRPHRWAGLVDPLIEIRESPTAAALSAPPTIVVKDRADGQPRTSAPTIVSLSTDTSYPKGLKPDIEFAQIGADEVLIRTAAFNTALTITGFPDETSFLGLDQNPVARHRNR